MSWIDKPFVLSLGCGAVTSLLVYLGKLDSTNYMLIIVGTVGAYIGGWTVKQVKGTPADRANEGTP
ncbi:MAG: hypothetical protein H0X13_15515 [Ramlibacter sp.]|nr:hypothetical protein [Ramlibacter sp.]